MEQAWNERLQDITGSFSYFLPELILLSLFFILIISALFKPRFRFLLVVAALGFAATTICAIAGGWNQEASLFGGMLKTGGLAAWMKILIDISAMLTCLLSWRGLKRHEAEYFSFLTAAVLGGHLLLMTTHFLMIFLAMELISISAYVLAGYSFDKPGSEGSLKYFLFGATASAIMLYGFSILYGLTGTVDFSTYEFFEQLSARNSPFALFAAFMVLSGFLFKITAAPMQFYAPDVYEGAPVPVIAFLSVAPKLAGLGVLTKFVLAVHLFGQSVYDWQVIISVIAILTITIGNFSALWQQNAKRMMAYSSIAHAGFLLVGIAAFLPQGIHFMLFYAAIYTLMNFLVFLFIGFFESRGITALSAFSGTGKIFTVPCIFLLTGLIALTGIPPTAGFTAKLFIFSALWQAYDINSKPILLWLLIFGLLNTVIALFYYLRIPYFSFLKSGQPSERQNIISFENLFGFILVLLILGGFFMPGLLMGWINKINFVF